MYRGLLFLSTGDLRRNGAYEMGTKEDLEALGHGEKSLHDHALSEHACRLKSLLSLSTVTQGAAC